MTERRYDEEETAAIFARASEATPREVSALPAKQGWSLAELQAIGREMEKRGGPITREEILEWVHEGRK